MNQRDHALIHLHFEIRKLCNETKERIWNASGLQKILLMGAYKRVRQIEEKVEQFNRQYPTS